MGSRLTMISRAPFCLAISGNPAAGWTTSDDPSTRNVSQPSVAASARAIGSIGMAWPNEMVATFTSPPQARQ